MRKDMSISLNREIINHRTANALIGVMFFVFATALGAYVRIPVAGSPVPITLQTFFVLLSGAVLGKRLGLFSQLSYVMLGIFGFQMFQGLSFGATYLLGPTGGYILGFAVASFVVGRLLENRADIASAVFAFTIGSIVIYALGAMWLIYLYRIGVSRAITIGVAPFVLGDILKVLIAAMIYSGIARRSKEIFSN